MRAKGWSVLSVTCAVFLLAACRPQVAPTAVVVTQPPQPTVEAPTNAPTATPLIRDTLPPTWTPAISWTPSITLTPSITTTPTPSPTITPSPTLTPTPTQNATNQALLSKPLAAACATFAADPDKNQTQFTDGKAPTIVWTSVDSAAAYVVRVYDTNLTTIFTQTTTDTQIALQANLFQGGQTYTWDVSPLDGDGVQICPSRGALLIAAL